MKKTVSISYDNDKTIRGLWSKLISKGLSATYSSTLNALIAFLQRSDGTAWNFDEKFIRYYQETRKE
jgi:hypothetical protein